MLFYHILVKRLHNNFDPSRNHAFSCLLAGSFIMFSKHITQVPEPAKTELKNLSSSQQLHIDGLCDRIENIVEKGIYIDEPDICRELELMLEILASYSSLVTNRPNLEKSRF